MNKEEFDDYFEEKSQIAWKSFWEELKTDENADYRRGFKAGILCSTLQLKIDLLRGKQDD